MAAAAFGRPVVLAASADTLTKVQSIIAEQLGTDAGDVGAEKKFADLGADSLDTVEIMMALEEQFDISIDEEGELQLPPPPLPPGPQLPPCPCPLLPCPLLPPPLLAPHSQPPDRRGVKRRGGGSSICGARPSGPAPAAVRPAASTDPPGRRTQEIARGRALTQTPFAPPDAGAEKITTVQEAADMIEDMK